MPGFNLSSVFDAVANAVPDQEVMVWRERRVTYREVNERATAIASWFAGRGLGARQPRAELAGHESGHDHVALYLYNGNEYLESWIGAFRARLGAVNVNYRYVDEELVYLLRDSQAKAVVYHAEFAPRIAAIRDQLPELVHLVQVADDSDNPLLPGAVAYEDVLATPAAVLPEPDGEDPFLIYTGGTTGMPKGVIWTHHDIFVSAMGGTPYGSTEPYADLDAIAKAAVDANGGLALLMIAPLMHGAAQWGAFHFMVSGGKLVVPDNVRAFEPHACIRVAVEEKVFNIPVVGDAIARPLVEVMESGEFDLSTLGSISNGGAPMSPAIRHRLLAAAPHLFITDAVGSSESGIQMSQMSTAGAEAESAVFTPNADTVVLDEGLARQLEPGEGIGWLARRGRIPLGYLGDAEKTARTFPEVLGSRWVVAGDRAELLADGRIKLLGREGVTINSGGEKIFAEEVEMALAAHPAIKDVVVVGRPSEKWGSEVVAIVVVEGEVTDEELLAEAGTHVARYKLPKAIVRRDALLRSAAGKADYRWAKEQAVKP